MYCITVTYIIVWETSIVRGKHIFVTNLLKINETVGETANIIYWTRLIGILSVPVAFLWMHQIAFKTISGSYMFKIKLNYF